MPWGRECQPGAVHSMGCHRTMQNPARAGCLRRNILVCLNEGYAQSFFRFSRVLFFEYSFFMLSNFERYGPPSAESQAGSAPSFALRLCRLGLHCDLFSMLGLRMSLCRSLRVVAVACLCMGHTSVLWSLCSFLINFHVCPPYLRLM